MTCLFDARWCGQHGIGRFATEIMHRLPVVAVEREGRPMSPLDPFKAPKLRLSPGDWFLSPGYNAPLFSRFPSVLTVHDLNHIDRPENSSAVKRLYYRTVLRQLCRNAAAVLTVSDFSKSRLMDWFGLEADKVFNVGNGVSAAFRPDGAPTAPRAPYVLCVSNRKGHKNESRLLDAFALAKLPAEVELVLTGVPDSALLQKARALGLGSRLVFSGGLDDERLADLYRGALFLLFPSLYEGFGLPIVEAFSCGTPVITSAVTAMPEIAGEAACLIDPHDVEDIAGSIARLYGSQDLRRDLRQKGFVRARSFTWQAVADRIRATVDTLNGNQRMNLSWS